MPRTEKKFGQINVGAASSLQTIVPASANRKNVLLNLTTSGTESVNVITATGDLSFPAISATLSQATSFGALSPSTLTTTVRPAFYFNNNGTKLLTETGGSVEGITARRLSISATSSALNATFINSVSVTVSQSGRAIAGAFGSGNVEPIDTAPYNTTRQDTGVYTSMIKWTLNDKAVAIEPAKKDLYEAAYGASTYKPSSIHTFDTNVTGSVPSNFYPSFVISGQTYAGNISGTVNRALQILGRDIVFAAADGVTSVVTGANPGSNRFWMYSFDDSVTDFTGTFKAAIAVSATTSGVTQHDVIANFCLVDYNSTYSEYVCASATTALSDSTLYWKTTGGSTGSAITSSAAGFRIIDSSKYSVDGGLAYLTGAYTYPVAPTGVTVPTSVRPVASVKFSPTGKYLAVAYNRNYSGTGNTNSVVVIYERQAGGSWTHFASSGSAIASKPQNFDALKWTPDGSGVMVHSGTNLYVWFPGIATNLSPYSTFTYTGGKPDLYTLPVTYSGSLDIAVSGSSAGPAIAVFPAVTGGQLIQVYPTNWNLTTGTESVASTVHGQRLFITTAGSASVTNYVNTPVQNLTVTTNQVVQISNIVLEANERLDMEFSTGSRLNAIAYGVEIG